MIDLYTYSDGIYTIGKRSWSNIFPDGITFKKLDDYQSIEWKTYSFTIDHSDTIKYWHDSYTGCEYDGFDKMRVDITNQHMLEYAYEVLDELKHKIDELGMYNG